MPEPLLYLSAYFEMHRQTYYGRQRRIKGMDRNYEGEDMQTDQAAPKTIDEYIAGFPQDIQAVSYTHLCRVAVLIAVIGTGYLNHTTGVSANILLSEVST